MLVQYKIRSLVQKVLCISLLVVGVSCVDQFEGMNTDPLRPPYDKEEAGLSDGSINMPDSVSATELAELKAKEGSATSVFKSMTYEGMYNDYQRTTSLSHDIYAGYFANNNPAFTTSSPNYVYTDGWSSKRWDHFYKDRCKEYGELVRIFRYVDREKYHNAFYITRIYFAYLASQMTDTYGSIPLSAYLQGGSIPEKVKYDSQERVYDIMFALLTEAVDSIKPNNNMFLLGENDCHYNGDAARWVRFANTLRLRLALRISNVNPSRAAMEGRKALSAPGGLMKDQGDNLRTIPKHAPVALGGDDAGGDENIHALCSFAWLDVCMSKDLELSYKSQSSEMDPRCSILWFRPTPKSRLDANKESTKDFMGCEIGSDDIVRESGKYSVLRCNIWEGKVLNDKYWFGYSRESVWFSYAESRFLLAEAALRDWSGVDGTPNSLFEEGIRASFAYYKMADKSDSYITSLQAYADPLQNPFLQGDKEAMLELIITQKWLAVFPNGNEGWAEFRRTDYPALRNHQSNRSIDVALNKFIKRVRFPNSEFDYNADNLPKLESKQDVRVWWDVTDTNDGQGNRVNPNNFR